jgi:hypothetical protein
MELLQSERKYMNFGDILTIWLILCFWKEKLPNHVFSCLSSSLFSVLLCAFFIIVVLFPVLIVSVSSLLTSYWSSPCLLHSTACRHVVVGVAVVFFYYLCCPCHCSYLCRVRFMVIFTIIGFWPVLIVVLRLRS